MSIKEVEQLTKLPPKHASTKLKYYYESHPTKEDLMGTSLAHSRLVHYLMNLLEWYYRVERWLIGENLQIYQTTEYKEYPLAPDVAVFKGVVISAAEERRLRSWRIQEGRPAPTVVFEIASQETWKEDLEPDKKVGSYGRMGVKEYFAYDPHEPRVWTKEYHQTRLLGWRYLDGNPQPLKADERCGLWSEELESWLVPDEGFFRLYDQNGKMRQTQAQDTEQREMAERTAKEAAWAKLRELGIDPETLK